MYKSNLHNLLLQVMADITWTKSTKDEDNFRHVICSSLYKFISPNCVEIPSTRSSRGDINIFGRKIELKYASKEKTVSLSSIIADFNRLLKKEIEFCIISISLETEIAERYVDESITLPSINPATANLSFADTGVAPNTYKAISIFLAATYPHLTPISVAGAVGRPSFRYLSFEDINSIFRSSFLETPQGLIHVDVIGSCEDGLITFLYKRADHVKTTPLPTSVAQDIAIPCTPIAISIGKFNLVDVKSQTKKTGGVGPLAEKMIEKEIPYFKIF